jgi:hypothetical protein
MNMPERPPAQTIAITLVSCAVALSTGLCVVRPEAGEARNAVLALNWFLWVLFVVMYPISVLQSGKVTGTQPTSVSYRARSPARYWTGLVATSIFWLSILLLVTGLTWIAWHPEATG